MKNTKKPNPYVFNPRKPGAGLVPPRNTIQERFEDWLRGTPRKPTLAEWMAHAQLTEKKTS